jgi:hypothetical protein
LNGDKAKIVLSCRGPLSEARVNQPSDFVCGGGGGWRGE